MSVSERTERHPHLCERQLDFCPVKAAELDLCGMLIDCKLELAITLSRWLNLVCYYYQHHKVSELNADLERLPQ